MGLILRTYAGGGGVNEKRTGAYKGGRGGGSEIGDFTAYVLYECPLMAITNRIALAVRWSEKYFLLRIS